MSNTMKQMIPAMLVAVFVAVVIPRLAALAPLFAVLAVAGWTVTMLWVLHRAKALPRPLAAVIDRVAPQRRIEALQAEQRDAERRRLADAVTAPAIQGALDEVLIGQEPVTAVVADAVELFVGKKNPAKPLSLVIAGPPGSGRTSFAEGLSAALAPHGAGRLFRIDCASEPDLDLAQTVARLGGLSLPILLLDNVDRIADQHHGGRVMTDLIRLVDGGGAGTSTLTRAILVSTIALDAAAAKQLYARTDVPGGPAVAMRDAVRAAGRIPADLLDRTDLVAVLKPLGEMEQIAVVWKTFCAMAAREHEIVIVDDRLGMGDGIEDFLIAARERWTQAGVSGVREAARFISSAADAAFLAAGRAGYVRVRARWDAAAGRIRLDPVEPEDQAKPVAPTALPAEAAPGGHAASMQDVTSRARQVEHPAHQVEHPTQTSAPPPDDHP